MTGALITRGAVRRGAAAMEIVTAVDAYGKEFAGLDEKNLRLRADALRPSLRRDPRGRRLVAEGFALVREAASRTIGRRHYGVQLAGGWALVQGMVAEMETGEGKTLTVTLAASVAALGGAPVHVVTVNDYLARRDAEAMGPIYSALGLSVGLVEASQPLSERRRAYAADIVYVTSKELVFDYLRDRLASERMRGVRGALRGLRDRDRPALRLRGLCSAIVDEADSVLIDEARTPLILGSQAPDGLAAGDLELALADVKPLARDIDFFAHAAPRQARLASSALEALARRAQARAGGWRIPAWREELWRQALVALHLCRRDVDYIVRGGRVEIIDEFTGRIMPGRSWGAGLQELVELKEGCEQTGRSLDVARLSYQRFFSRYQNLAGLTGTATEASRELWSVYRLRVARLRTHYPQRRVKLKPIVAAGDRKWTMIAEKVAKVHATGRPVLVGTRTLAASLLASAALREAGLPHQLLNAAQDHQEAEIISRAGQRGEITIATNMAGRGADIPLGPGVAALGGLHVIVSELHESRRIDRQLLGRCARHGEPGSYQMLLGADDALALNWPSRLRRVVGPYLGYSLMRIAQAKLDWRNASLRHQLLRAEESLDDVLAFCGVRE